MIEVKNLTKTYVPKKGIPVVALNNVNLQIEETGLVFILGKSGSGKSTLLNLLGGLDKYDHGDIIIKDKSTKDFTQADFDSYRNTYVGFIFQEYNILDDFTVGANIALAIELQGRKASNEEVNEILKILDLEGYGARRPNELSGGQKQRVAIARALVKNPDIILADEPTGALDSQTGIQIFNILKDLAKDKLVLVVSHDREFAEDYGDRVIELADGKVISDIKKETMKKEMNGVDNLHYVKNEGLVVKEGYKLTTEDLGMINEYLEKEKSLNLITKPQESFSVNQVFVETSDNLEIKSYPDKFTMLKSKLPYKMSLKMGASGLNHKKLRLFFTILLSLVAFTLFGVSDTLASYDKVDATVNSIIDGDIKSASFSKEVERTFGNENYSYTNKIPQLLSAEDLDFINTNIGSKINRQFKPVYTGGTIDRWSGAAYSFDLNLIPESGNIFHQDYYYLRYISGFVEYSKEDLEELGFTVYGIMPSKDDEIAISSYIFEHFTKYGYQLKNYEDPDLNIEIKAENINSHNDLIGKYLTLQGRNGMFHQFKISAIVDTLFDNQKYESLQNSTDGFYEYFLAEEFRTVINYGFHGLGFVNPGYIDKLIAENKTSGIPVQNFGYFDIGTDYQFLSFSIIDKLDQYQAEELFFFNETKTNLSENEILVSYDFYLEIIRNKEFNFNSFPDYGPKFNEVFYDIMENTIREYAEDNWQIAEERNFYNEVVGNNELSTEEKIDSLYIYLINERGDGYFKAHYVDKSGNQIVEEELEKRIAEIKNATNDFIGDYYMLLDKIRNDSIRLYTIENYKQAEENGFYADLGLEEIGVIEKIEVLFGHLIQEAIEGKKLFDKYLDKSGHEIVDAALKPWQNKIFQETEAQKFYHNYSDYSKPEDGEPIKIVGCFLSGQNKSVWDKVIVDDDFYSSLVEFGEINPYTFAISAMPTSRADLKQLAEFSYQDNNSAFFPLQNAVTPTLELANDIVEQVASVFLYIGIGFAVFAGLMLSNFIGTSVARKKREIGILRALGARSSDVFQIFFSESLIIAIINFVLAAISTNIVVKLLNDTLRYEGGITVTIFNFSIRQVLLLILISVFVALVSSYLPVSRIARKKPVDAISNR